MMGVKLGKEYIATHRPRWDALPGPVILAYVEDPDDRNSKIYWQDLKSDDSYSKTNKAVVLVPKFQTFGSEAKGALRRLAGSVPDSVPLQTIDLTKARSLLATPAFRSEEHTSELQSLMRISYAVFCLKKTKINT